VITLYRARAHRFDADAATPYSGSQSGRSVSGICLRWWFEYEAGVSASPVVSNIEIYNSARW